MAEGHSIRFSHLQSAMTDPREEHEADVSQLIQMADYRLQEMVLTDASERAVFAGFRVPSLIGWIVQAMTRCLGATRVKAQNPNRPFETTAAIFQREWDIEVATLIFNAMAERTSRAELLSCYNGTGTDDHREIDDFD